MRILFILGVIIIFLLVIKLIIKIYAAFSSNNTGENKTSDDSTQKMIKCAKCNIYIAEKDSFEHEGKQYCSKEHSKK